ncbi:hypothetical protein [Streptomyces sp. NPDC101776]|uniref:hypothetical protein n=1 Tax=Streptomyces sp. NPDC101776 TaxID=3366146 RepID=UPI003810420F
MLSISRQAGKITGHSVASRYAPPTGSSVAGSPADREHGPPPDTAAHRPVDQRSCECADAERRVQQPEFDGTAEFLAAVHREE